MAALNNASHTPLSNKNDAGNDSLESKLPSGGCNYTNLALGANAPRCGCKKYWDKALIDLSASHAATGFCMCEHHACYHDNVPERNSFAASTPQQGARDLSGSVQDGTLSAILDIGKAPFQTNDADPVHWSRYLNGSSQGLPPIPSQCLLPSDNGSVTSGNNSAYYRPFGGQGLNTLAHSKQLQNIAEPLSMSKPARMQIYEDKYGVQHLQSLTDIATPSVQNSQEHAVDLANHATSVARQLETVMDKQTSDTRAPLHSTSPQAGHELSAKAPDDACPDLRNSQEQQLVLHVQQLREPNDLPARMDNHEQRLDQLENVSFSHPAIDQLQEAHEHLDDRIGNLEHRISDLETVQLANEAGSVTTRPSVEGSFTSHTSHASSVVPHIELSRVEALEAQVAELQSIAPPTYSRPWELEVVYLPFGLRLAGIWSSHDVLTQNSRSGSITPGRNTQNQRSSQALAQAKLVFHDHVSTWESSATDLHGEGVSWLMARACGVDSKVDQRLRSRGLVRRIQICGQDAGDVQSAMLKAFGELPNILCEDPYSAQDENLGIIPRSLQSYLGLQAQWIPLRKLHKDSGLRFLTPAEMITPALWNAPFLSSSVAMRHSGTRRLYVTQRDSYIQEHSGCLADWTWQKLRQLPRVYDESAVVNHTPEADAQEECWMFDARLDPPPTPHTSFHSSFHSQISQLSIDSLPGTPNQSYDVNINAEPVSPSDHFSSAPASPAASTPRTSLPSTLPQSPLKQRNPFRMAPRRTISMSSTIPLRGEPSSQAKSHSSKRRVPSFNRDTNSSPERMTSTLDNAQASSQPLRPLELTKRRRISRSPSRPRNTPRWSVGSPSPFPVHDVDREGGLTPFAYATPHSNATYVPRSHAGEVNVYEDEDDDEDYFARPSSEDDRESTTDVSGAEDDTYEGYEQNALSDFETAQQDEHGISAVDNDEWHGVEDQAYDSRYPGLVNKSFTTYYDAPITDGQEDDAASDVSETPSEYPSTQQNLAQHQAEPVVNKQTIGLIKSSSLYERRQKRGMDFTIHVDDEVERMQ